VRGERPWDQFLNYCTTVAQMPGSQLRAAQLSDERYLPEVEALMEQERFLKKRSNPRPPLQHFSAEVAAMYDLSDDIRLMLQVAYGVKIKFRDRPATLADRAEQKRRDKGRAKIAALLDEEVS
jgi:hypothetical protein